MAAYKIKAVFLPVMLFVLTSVSAAYQKEVQPKQYQGLFDSDEIIDIRLEGDIRALMNDWGEEPSYHFMKIHYQSMGIEETQGLRVRARGNFRRLRENCDTPPLRFNFSRHEVPEHSIFAGQRNLKLVVPCKGEEYVIREYLAYKIYNLLTDYSFRVRPVRLTYHDSSNNRTSNPQFAFLIEHKNSLATRSNAALVERINLRPEIVDREAFLRMSVFAYMTGNTDWSVQYLHNIDMLFLHDDKVYVAVPYDFDLVGLVSAPYAKPAEALRLRSVRDRVYRGYCLEDLTEFNTTFEQFRELRPEIYKLLTENTLLSESYIQFATRYLDDFYNTLNDPKKVSRVFSYPCKSYGTGNIVIRGLRN
jgi:hypothetical protein